MSRAAESDATDSTDRSSARKGLRIAVEVGMLCVAIAFVLGAARGLGVIAPGVAAALRLLVHPATLISALGIFFLLRTRRTRPKSAPDRSDRHSA